MAAMACGDADPGAVADARDPEDLAGDWVEEPAPPEAYRRALMELALRDPPPTEEELEALPRADALYVSLVSGADADDPRVVAVRDALEPVVVTIETDDIGPAGAWSGGTLHREGDVLVWVGAGDDGEAVITRYHRP